MRFDENPLEEKPVFKIIFQYLAQKLWELWALALVLNIITSKLSSTETVNVVQDAKVFI